MPELDERLAELGRLLDMRLRDLVGRDSTFGPLYPMMAYHIGWLDDELRPYHSHPGKRVRPSLCFLTCESLGGTAEMAVPGAAAVELIHNFSLVHDDIQDNSPQRRTRATVWSLWGANQGINVGDALYGLAYLALTDERLAPEQIRRATKTLANTSVDLCEGQALDLTYQHEPSIDMSQYLTMIGRKTGALFACSTALGAILSGAPDDVVEVFGQYGRLLGDAFQMQDDVLGVWGDDATTGKPARDVHDHKHGLPSVIAAMSASQQDLSTLRALYASTEPLADQDVRWLLDLFARLNVREHAEDLVRETLKRAEKAVDEIVPSVGSGEALRQLVERTARRSA